MQDQPRRVQRIVIKNLFRFYTIDIPLRLDERVTILHGRNGVGKTVTLGLISALLNGNYWRLAQVPFDSMRIELSDGSSIHVARPTVGALEDAVGPDPEEQFVDTSLGREHFLSGCIDDVPMQVIVTDPTGRWHRYHVPTSFPKKAIETAVGLASVGGTHWLKFDEEIINTDQVYLNYADQISRYYDDGPALPWVPVHMIESQRLHHVTFSNYSNKVRMTSSSAVTTLAEKMADRVSRLDSKYRTTSTALDDDLPRRLFASQDQTRIDHDDLVMRASNLNNERERLQRIGILSKAPSPFDPGQLDKTKERMFAIVLADNERKLAVFKELADRAEIMLEILNRKLAPKRVVLDKDYGFKVYSHDGQPLELSMLSSGEQHQIVLLNDLLFLVKPGSLVLLDEPEMSLHVTWQVEFLDDLMKIAKLNEFDVILATHSPYIVGNRRDLMVQLGEAV